LENYTTDPGIRTTQRASRMPDSILNPVMTTDELVKGQPWPPKSQKARLIRYAQNKLLYAGRHDQVYQQWASMITDNPDTQRALVYIAVNLPGAITRLVADLLYGEQGENLGMTVKNEKAQAALTRILSDNHVQQVAYETGGLGASYRGDGVYKVYLQDNKARIVSQPAQNWFPVADSGNVKEISKHILAWEVTIGDQKYLRKETHLKGQIINEAFKLDGTTIGNKVNLADVGVTKRPEVESTGVDRFLVIHCPNIALDDELFGLDDYEDLDTLFPVYNTLLSRNDLILMKHSDPNMYGPEDNLIPDPDKPDRYTVKTGGNYFGVPQGSEPPGYLTWDGQLEAAFKQLEQIAQAIYIVSETSPAAFGLDTEGGAAESGRALRFRLMRTIAKTSRKKLYADPALKDLLEVAMLLETAKGGGGYEVERPSIDWRDGLPNDPLEEVQIVQARGVDKSMTRKDAIMSLDGVDEKTAEERAAEIQEEMDASLPEFGRSGFETNLNDRGKRKQTQGGE
jgi:hypothetical protein